MAFPARAAGTCCRCNRPYQPGTSITSVTGPTVLPARFEHAPRCPIVPVPQPLALPPVVEPVEVPRTPLRVRGRLAGHLFEMVIEGLPVEMIRTHDDGIEIRVRPAVEAAAETGRRTA